jgi:hypothetical protein
MTDAARHAFRVGFAPRLSDKSLGALLVALATDDARLMQCQTTAPPGLLWLLDWPVEAACVLGFCGWQGEELGTVGEVSDYFVSACHEADQLLGEPTACRHLIEWIDGTPRDQMRVELLTEVEQILSERQQVAA